MKDAQAAVGIAQLKRLDSQNAKRIELAHHLTERQAGEQLPLPAEYCNWEVQDFSIKQPLCDLRGDPEQGRRIVADSHGGNCLACHRLPIPEEPLHGTVGPPLDGLAGRMSTGQMRLHVVDQRQFNPLTIMPGFYRDPRLANRVADAFFGKTFLSAQQVEDVVAYLETLQ